MNCSVHWNFHKKKFSITHKGRVIKWVDRISLEDAKFSVGAKGRERVLREKRKNVHAKVHGRITDRTCNLNRGVVYNPYVYEHFVLLETGDPVFTADRVNFEVVNGSPRIWI